jgi:hypothetical protein
MMAVVPVGPHAMGFGRREATDDGRPVVVGVPVAGGRAVARQGSIRSLQRRYVA